MAARMQLPFPMPGVTALKEILISSISVTWDYVDGASYWDYTSTKPAVSARTRRTVHIEFTEAE